MNRRIIILWIVCTGVVLSAYSQKTISLHLTAGSGVSYFRGTGTVNRSVFLRNNIPFPTGIDTTREHFGRQPLTSFMAGIQVNLRLLPSFILTIDGLYEHSGGELDIDSVYSPTANYKTTGDYKRQYDYISINPQLGRRISFGPVGLRISAGVDYCIKVTGSSTANFIDQNGQRNSVGGSGDVPEVNDIRLTGGVALNVKKLGITVNYKYGIVDYLDNRPGRAYSRQVQVRLLYRLLGI